MDIIQPPRLVDRPEFNCLGIRQVTPFRGFLARRDALLKELVAWLHERDITGTGPFFLRYHVIDMAGDMDIEVGARMPGPHSGDGRVASGSFPAGRYATLTYRDHAMRATRALLDWVAAEGLELDREGRPEGDAFACRYEAYLTDPRTEPRKTKWEVELSMRLRS
jgi:effector-binding domain-containing protein